jgi:hypothetical protein
MRNRIFFATGFVFFGFIVGFIAASPIDVSPRNPLTQHHEGAAGDGAENKGASPTAEERTADYTWWLDFWTGGLVIVAAIQAGMFFAQLSYMRRGMADTKAAADAANVSAEVAKSALTDLERPWLFIDLEPGLLRCPKPTEFCDKEAVFNLVNYGRFPAVIEEFACTLSIGVDPATPIVRDDFHRVLAPNGIIPDGRAYLAPTGLDEDFVWNSEETVLVSQVPRAPEGERLFAIFSIKYRGVGSREHESLFCWQWNYMFNRWDRGPAEYNRQT